MLSQGPVNVAVHVGLPVAHVDHHVPGEPGLTRGGVSHAPGTLVVDVAGDRVRVVALHPRALEVRGLRGCLGHVEVRVPVCPGDTQEILQS